MAHIQLIGLSEQKSPDNKVWKMPYAIPIIISQLMKTEHSFECIDTHLNKLEYRELCAKTLEKERQVYGISAWSHNYLQLKYLAANIRKKYKNAVIVVGGLISGNDEVVLRNTEVDIVATGAEGEYILPEILDCVDRDLRELHEINGISFKDRGKNEVVKTQERHLMTNDDFQAKERPAYEYFDEQLHEIATNLESRTDVPIKAFPMLTSRGCPFHCTFCGHMYGHRMLRKRWDLFFDEVEFLISRYGFQGFFSHDTNLFLNEKDAMEYCRIYRERNMSFDIIAELRLTFGNYDMFKELNEHGVKIAVFGYESGSQEMLNRMKKGTDLSTCKRIIADTIRAGTMIHGNFIFGTPGENRRTIRETGKFMLWLEKQIHRQKKEFAKDKAINTSGYGWSILTLSPTSELYREARENDLIEDEEAYLASLCDEKFMQLASGSSLKISLCQEAGNVNMSEFTSRKALSHYVKFSLYRVKFFKRFSSFSHAVKNIGKTLEDGFKAFGHYLVFVVVTIKDKTRGKKGYRPLDKREN